jgi:hypothetical protein
MTDSNARADAIEIQTGHAAQRPAPTPDAPTYMLFVHDSFNAGQDDAPRRVGPFSRASEALAEARRIVDSYLLGTFEPGTTADELFRRFTGYGDAPVIVPRDDDTRGFSAHDYARARCDEICAPPEALPYVVLIDDNFHYMDEDERVEHGRFATYEEAEAACRRIVDRSLEELRAPGMTADALFAQYASFGEDPFVRSPDPERRFSARDYARVRCMELTR